MAHQKALSVSLLLLAPVVMAAKFHGLACRCPQWTTLA